MKEDIMLTSQITVHNNFILKVNTILGVGPRGRGGSGAALWKVTGNISVGTKCSLSVLVEQFRPARRKMSLQTHSIHGQTCNYPQLTV